MDGEKDGIGETLGDIEGKCEGCEEGLCDELGKDDGSGLNTVVG